MGFDIIQDGKLLDNFKSLVAIITPCPPQMNIMDETEMTVVQIKVPEVIWNNGKTYDGKVMSAGNCCLCS